MAHQAEENFVGETLFGRYYIKQQLSQKLGKWTLLARNLENQNPIVIKLLVFGRDFEWDHLKLFEREAKTLKSLNHWAIPTYVDYFEVDRPNWYGFALAQTYIAAPSLEELLRLGHTWTEPEIKQIAKTILQVLMYLHGQQLPIIHRDIKPSNILLTNRSSNIDRSGNSFGQAYLIDFGSVQTSMAIDQGTYTIVGTYGYMPLEQFGGRTVPASDLYSLGATLITLATGAHPADLPQLDGRLQFEHATQLSTGFVVWLKQMTAPYLGQRFNAADKALAALEQVDQQHPGSVWVEKPSDSKIQFIQNSTTLAIVIPALNFSLLPSLLIGFLSLFAIAWITALTGWTMGVLNASFPISLFFIMFSLPFWAVGIGLVVGILFALFGKIRLSLDHQISLNYELFGFKFKRSRPSPIQSVNKLEVTQRHFIKDLEGDRVEIHPQIIIWAGVKKYELGAIGLTTEPELSWLAAELGRWLNLPITYETDGVTQ
jgi:serine/threonine protein kinase